MTDTRSEFVAAVDLNAYIDGELDPERQAEIESHLLDHPDDAAMVAAMLTVNQSIRAAALEMPVSRLRGETEELERELAARLGLPSNVVSFERRPAPPAHHLSGAPGRVFDWRKMAAAGIAAVFIGLGWASNSYLGDNPFGVPVFVDEAADAHVALISEPGPPAQAGVERINQFFRDRNVAAMVPDLGAAAFQVSTARLISTDEGPAVQVIYQDADQRRLSLTKTIHKIAEDWSPRVTSRAGLTMAYWHRDRVGYTIGGNVPQATIEHFVSLIRTSEEVSVSRTIL